MVICWVLATKIRRYSASAAQVVLAWRQEGKVGMEADGWKDKRELEVVGLVVEVVETVVVVVEMVVAVAVDTTENEQMGMRRKNNWEAGRKTILEADDESDLKQMLESFIGLR